MSKQSIVISAIASVLLCILIVAVVTSILFPGIGSGRVKKGYAEIQWLYDALDVGDAPEDVRSAHAIAEEDILTLHELSSTNWLVQSPFAFGARNWNLWLELSSNGVTAIRVRSADSADWHPKEAPPDKE